MILTILLVCFIISAALAASLWSLIDDRPMGRATVERRPQAVESPAGQHSEGRDCAADEKLVCPGVALKAPDENLSFKGTF